MIAGTAERRVHAGLVVSRDEVGAALASALSAWLAARDEDDLSARLENLLFALEQCRDDDGG